MRALYYCRNGLFQGDSNQEAEGTLSNPRQGFSSFQQLWLPVLLKTYTRAWCSACSWRSCWSCCLCSCRTCLDRHSSSSAVWSLGCRLDRARAFSLASDIISLLQGLTLLFRQSVNEWMHAQHNHAWELQLATIYSNRIEQPPANQSWYANLWYLPPESSRVYNKRREARVCTQYPFVCVVFVAEKGTTWPPREDPTGGLGILVFLLSPSIAFFTASRLCLHRLPWMLWWFP